MEINSFNFIDSDYMQNYARSLSLKAAEDDSFSSVLASMMNSLNETNDLTNKAESEEIRFALGQADNTHDLLVAESKASVALQYTVAVRDKIIEAYREIMQMQI